MKPKLIFRVSTGFTIIALLAAWHKDPLYNTIPSPSMAVYFSIFGFVMASLLIFCANILLAFSKAKLAKNDEELEAIVTPALQGQKYDERILKWTLIPRAVVCGVSLGAICAAVIRHFAK